MERLTISLPRTLREEVLKIAKQKGASEAAVIRAALTLGLPALCSKLMAEATGGPVFRYGGEPGAPLELKPSILKEHESEEVEPEAAEADGPGGPGHG